jgi:hypothetical protein
MWLGAPVEVGGAGSLHAFPCGGPGFFSGRDFGFDEVEAFLAVRDTGMDEILGGSRYGKAEN